MAVVVNDDIVTKFLLNTCRRQPTKHDLWAVLWSAEAATKRPGSSHMVTLLSGSSAEFYIRPMLPCVDDIDIMLQLGEILAIPAGYPAPTELPAQFHGSVMVADIVESQHPGYVYLKQRYILTEGDDDGRYTAELGDTNRLYSYDVLKTDAHHGPAQTQAANTTFPAIDLVDCVRCLSWPTQAADWPTRHRNTRDWPDSATVGRVVSNGCDLVHVAHRRCRQDERESKRQWRLSFSRAEVVLLNGWTPVQQIVYHMLRVFVRTCGLRDITDSTGAPVISNYHIKTLMLWACECKLKPRGWWDSCTNVVRICMELLRTLAVWRNDARCPHYFIDNCNLIDTVLTNASVITDQMLTITESWMTSWFINNYIAKCARLCPDRVKLLYGDVSTTEKLQDAVSAVAEWRQTTALEDLWDVHNTSELYISFEAWKWCTTVHSCVHRKDRFASLNMQHATFITAIGFLHCALKRDFNDETLAILSVLCGQSVGTGRYSSHPGSVLSLSQAGKLMKVVANSSRSTVQLIEIELSKAYLHRALRCKDSDNDSIYCLANVYLAVLYSTTGQYQTAIDRCALVMMSQDHPQCSSRVVQGELLPKIDDNIDNALGLAVFYQYVRTTALNHQQQTQHAGVFDPKSFAHYVIDRCVSASRFLSRELSSVQCNSHYTNHRNSRTAMSTADLLLEKLAYFPAVHPAKNKPLLLSHQHRPANLTELNTSELIELLQLSAVEQLTTYRQSLAREFGSVATIVTTDFEAMYAYKRGDYRLCLQLSTENVHALSIDSSMAKLHTHPQFIQLFDDDIVSLTALTLIANPQCRNGGNYDVSISQLTLSLYLMTQCQLKLRHSATELVQTLDYVKVAQRRHRVNICHCVLEPLTLKLIERKAVFRLKAMACGKFLASVNKKVS